MKQDCDLTRLWFHKTVNNKTMELTVAMAMEAKTWLDKHDENMEGKVRNSPWLMETWKLYTVGGDWWRGAAVKQKTVDLSEAKWQGKKHDKKPRNLKT